MQVISCKSSKGRPLKPSRILRSLILAKSFFWNWNLLPSMEILKKWINFPTSSTHSTVNFFKPSSLQINGTPNLMIQRKENLDDPWNNGKRTVRLSNPEKAPESSLQNDINTFFKRSFLLEPTTSLKLRS